MLLDGLAKESIPQWKSKLRFFWDHYVHVEPDHPVYQAHADRLEFCIPFAIHGLFLEVWILELFGKAWTQYALGAKRHVRR